MIEFFDEISDERLSAAREMLTLAGVRERGERPGTPRRVAPAIQRNRSRSREERSDECERGDSNLAETITNDQESRGLAVVSTGTISLCPETHAVVGTDPLRRGNALPRAFLLHRRRLLRRLQTTFPNCRSQSRQPDCRNAQGTRDGADRSVERDGLLAPELLWLFDAAAQRQPDRRLLR